MNRGRGIVAGRILSSQCWLSGCDVATCLLSCGLRRRVVSSHLRRELAKLMQRNLDEAWARTYETERKLD